VDRYKIVNIYKPPSSSRLTPTAIPVFPHPCLYSGDFNCQHTDWGYNTISADGECLVDWATKNNLVLLNNPKDAPSFYSGRWNTGTNPDLAFVSTSDRCFHDRRVLDRFPRSQHRPSLITTSKIVVPVPSEPYKRWNFHKANWRAYSDITNQLAKDLPFPNTSYVDKAY